MGYSNSDIAHAWAHGISKGIGCRTGNMSTDGITLWSYSTPVACKIDGYIYMSADTMSPTTGRHLNEARRAIGYSTPVFYTHAFSYGERYPGDTHAAMIKAEGAYALKELIYALENLKTRKATKIKAVCHYQQSRQTIIEYAAKVLDRKELDALTALMPIYAADELTIAQYAADKKAREEAAAAARLIAIKKQQQKDKEQLNKWLTTGAGSCPGSFQRRYGNTNISDLLTIQGADVVTSQDAWCPIEHATRALKFYQSREITGAALIHQLRDIENLKTIAAAERRFTPYQTNGHKVPLGVYTLDLIDERGNVKAGCHQFSADVIARFIKQWREVLGL